MGYRIENKATELLIYDTDGKNITYYPKSELSVSASNGNIIISQNGTPIFSQEASRIDDPATNAVYDLVTTIKAYLQSDGGDNFSGGWADYNDSTGTPIAITGGGAAVVLTNNGAGVYTNTTYLPDGVTSLWNPSTNKFNWSELSIGDMVEIRMDVDVTTSSANTSITANLHLGAGGGAYTLPIVSSYTFKSSGTYHIVRYIGIYIGDSNTLNNGGQIKVSADSNCTVTVSGWYIKATHRGI